MSKRVCSSVTPYLRMPGPLVNHVKRSLNQMEGQALIVPHGVLVRRWYYLIKRLTSLSHVQLLKDKRKPIERQINTVLDSILLDGSGLIYTHYESLDRTTHADRMVAYCSIVGICRG